MKADEYQEKAAMTAAYDIGAIRGRMNAISRADLVMLIEMAVTQGFYAKMTKGHVFYGKDWKESNRETVPAPVSSWKMPQDWYTEEELRLLHSFVGLIDEVGEIAEVLRDRFGYGKPLDRDNLVEEFGDVQWYLSEGVTGLGEKLSEVMRKNNVKLLEKRYKGGFSEEAALERDTDSEQEVFRG